jgi:hypothetical protein
MISKKSTSAAAVTSIAMTATMLLATSVQSQTTTQTSIKTGVSLPARNVFALSSDNSIYLLRSSASQYVRLGRIDNVNGGNVIGIDFRPADNSQTKFYALTDLNEIYTVDVSVSPFRVAKVSSMGTPFTGGFGNVMDFNPVANALRVMGTNDQNLAVVNGTDGVSLSTTVAQTKFAYATGDVNAGQDPEITGGAYSNNFAGATTTIFYMIDHAKDTLVTINGLTATGSSNTAAGQLRTIGGFVGTDGAPLNMSPTTDFDIYTDSTGRNFLIGQTTRLLFSIDLAQINPNLPLGQTQKIVVRRGVPGTQLPNGSQSISGGVFDIAIPARAAQ